MDFQRLDIIKCVVWDLDLTIWNRVLAESDHVSLKKDVLEVIETLDCRGILQSISSRNEFGPAWKALQQFEIAEYFLYPQIHWNKKSDSIHLISEALNIPLNAIAFIDDQAFERDEVVFRYPEIRAYDSKDLTALLNQPEFNPSNLSDDARNRRRFYQNEVQRKQDEAVFEGNSDAFLRTLQLKLTITSASNADLSRLGELVQRTHQLNTTGIQYSEDDLKMMISSDQYLVWAIELEDRYGSYGKTGIIVIEVSENTWIIRLFLLSCRVMSRGIGAPLLNIIQKRANVQGVALMADFKPTDRNRMMYLTYKLCGFTEVENHQSVITLQCELDSIPAIPDYLHLSEFENE